MDWTLVLYHALTSALVESARQVRGLAERRHERRALPEPTALSVK